MKLLKNLIILSTILLVSSHAFAEDTTIEMLNKLDNESIVYSKKIVKINVYSREKEVESKEFSY